MMVVEMVASAPFLREVKRDDSRRSAEMKIDLMMRNSFGSDLTWKALLRWCVGFSGRLDRSRIRRTILFKKKIPIHLRNLLHTPKPT